MSTPNTNVHEMISIDGTPTNPSLPEVPEVKETITEAPVVEKEAETPKEVVEETTTEDDSKVSFDDFTKLLKNSEEVVEEKETPKDFEEDEVVKSTEPVVPKVTRKDLVTKDLQSRDVTGIDEDLAPHFQKNMSRQTFDKLKPIVLEHKKLKAEREALVKQLEDLKKGELPSSYYEHDEGFLLSPEFKAQSRKLNDAEIIYNHWKEQLAALEDGANDVSTIVYNEKGELVLGSNVAADKKVERALREQVVAAQQQFIAERNKTQEFVKNFKSKVSTADLWLNDFNSKIFAYFESEEGKQHRKAVDDIKNNLPAVFSASKLADPLAKSLFTNQALGNLVKNLQAKLAEYEKSGVAPSGPKNVAKQSQRKAGPTSSDSGAASSLSGDEVTFDMFQRIKEGVE